MNRRIVGICDKDPFDPLTWSGSAKYLFDVLKSRDALVEAISSEPSLIRKRWIQLINFNPDLEKWRFSYNLSPALFQARTAKALAATECTTDQFDIFLQIGAWFDFTDRGKPVVSYHDGNLARRLDSPYPYPAIAKRRIRRALEYERQLYSRIDVVCPMSHWLGRSFVRDFGVDEAKVHPIYAGINMPDMTELVLPDYHSQNILFVGKDFVRKGGTTLLAAFAKVRQEIPGASLTIIGPELKELPEGVVNPGFISKATPSGLAELKSYYEKAAVFALPTRYEPFGIAFAEAMAHGLPCVGTDNCAVPEIISDGQTGFTVPVDNVGMLAERIIDLLRNPAECRKFGHAGFVRYRKDFNWPAVVQKMYSAIDEHL